MLVPPRSCCVGQSTHPSPSLTLGLSEVREVRSKSKPRSGLARAWSRLVLALASATSRSGTTKPSIGPSGCSCLQEERRSGWGAERVGEGARTSSSVTPSASAFESVRLRETSRLRSMSECCGLGPGSSDVVALAPSLARRKVRQGRRICEETVRVCCGLKAKTQPDCLPLHSLRPAVI